MIYFVFMLILIDDRYDVEANDGINVVVFDVEVGCLDNVLYFTCVDGILRFLQDVALSGFHFTENHNIVFHGHNVEFIAFMKVPVPMQ